MAEKILNTRIQLKRDTLTNWNESSLVLKPGELAVAYVDVATKDEKGDIVHVPTAILKAGENKEGSTKTFKELPFVSAIAADVYAWAKKEGIEVIDEGTGEVISDVAWDATRNALVISRTDVVTPTKLTNALKSYYTKGEIDALIAGLSVGALEGRIKDLEDYKDTHGDIVTHNANEFAPADIDTGIHAVSLTGGTNNGTVKLTVDGTPTDNIAVTGLGDAAYTTIDALNTTAKGYADAKDTAIAEAKKAGDDAAAALDSYKGEMATTLGTKADKSVVEAMYTNAKIDELLNAKQDVIPAETYDAFGSAAAVEKKLEDYTKTADLDTTIDGLGYLKAADIEGKADKATTLEGYGITDAYTKIEADAKFADATEYAATKGLVDNFFSESGAENVMDTLTEIVTYIESDKEGAIQLGIDIEKAKSDAAAAVNTANAANTTAGQANTTAGEAKTLAEEAKEAATNATTGAAASAAAALASQNAAAQSELYASASESAATQAKADAEAAKGAAEQAKADAEAAKNAASGSAANAATSESNAAGSAATASEQAGAASASAATANTAKEAAVAAQGAAETAQGKAEDAQSAAETARDEAVAAKEAAEASNTSATAIANQAKETANGAKTAADAATEAVAGLHAIATSGNVNDLVQTSGDVLILDCGTASTVI